MSATTAWICATCGVQYAPSATPPAGCGVCLDERQYVPRSGQRWTTMAELAAAHTNRVQEVEPGAVGIGTEPSFAIGQRALLVQTAQGNVLWDCITLFDEETASAVEALGGVAAIAVSHPHYYGAMTEWARRFDAPVLLHEAERDWVTRPDPRIRFWRGERHDLIGGLVLHRLGGHFAGGQVLHWPEGAGGRGALLVGDIVGVLPDPEWVSFMYSYPNFIPLPAPVVRRIGERLEPIPFDRIYGAWWDRVIETGAKAAVRRSVDRYARAVERGLADT